MRPLENNISEILHVADCKVVTPDNMGHLKQMRFVSRFPATCKEHDPAIKRAIEADDWEELAFVLQTGGIALRGITGPFGESSFEQSRRSPENLGEVFHTHG